MTRQKSLLPLAVMSCTLFGNSLLKAAEDIQWQADYAAARKEASGKDRLLVIHFTTTNCLWCRRLEKDSLSDPAVIKTLNERCVALKVDGEREIALVEALGIQSYPTIVFASSDGHVLGKQEGYVDAQGFQSLMRRALDLVTPTESMTRAYDEAGKAIAAGDLPLAISFLKEVVADGKNRPLQVKAKKLLQEMEQQASALLVRARDLADKGYDSQARDAVRDLKSSYAGTKAALQADLMKLSKPAPLLAPSVASLDTRFRQAREEMAQARDEFRNQQYLACLDSCEKIISRYGDLPEADEAFRLAGEIKANPENLKKACDQQSDRLGNLYLMLAEACVKKGQTRQAVLHLEQVTRLFPDSRPAAVAQGRLARIRGKGDKIDSPKP